MNSVESNLAQFNRAFSLYVATWANGEPDSRGRPRTLDAALEYKGLDIGRRLRKGFAAHKWGGPGKHPGIALAELGSRSATGQGIKMRSSLKALYLSARAQLRTGLRNFIGPKSDKQKSNDVKKAVKLWQTFVGKELRRRQQGIGFLSTAFLWTTKRPAGHLGTFSSRGSAGGIIGTAEKKPGFFRITGNAPGAQSVAEKNGIVAGALSGASADIVTYLERKNLEAVMKFIK